MLVLLRARVTYLLWVGASVMFVAILAGCIDNPSQTPKHYYTWDGLEPDKWGSVWLLKRHIDPASKLSIVPPGAQMKDAVAIDTPQAQYKRSGGRSTFENMTLAFGHETDPVLVKIGSIIKELEISAWTRNSPLTSVVEQQFRALQYQYNRVDVPTACYSGFFDQLYTQLKRTPEPDLEQLSETLSPEKVCDTPVPTIAQRKKDPVYIYSIDHILAMIQAGKKVIFVDTRESDEYQEGHIPGAVNIKLRDVTASIAPKLDGADLVISYCVKDFRGYEVGLALSKAGVKHVGIMKPFGIRGWKQVGLPVTGKSLTEEAAMNQLKTCAKWGGCRKAG